MHERLPRWLAATLLACVSIAPSARDVLAQAGLPHIEDATTVPRGLLRVRGITAWTRFNERFTDGGSEALGAFLTADSLGVNKVPELASIQSLVQSASASPFTLTLGRSQLNATAREEIVPIGFEYGLTDRITLSVITPIVRRRVASVFRLDTAGSAANVGPNPMRFVPGAQLTNTLVQTQFASAATQLQARVNSCQANPAGAGCAALLARQAEAQLLIQSSQSFASDLALLYGGGTAVGSAFVPLTGSSAQDAVASRVAAFNAQYQDLLATSANLIQAVPAAAPGPAGPDAFEDFFIGEAGHDSLNFQERVGIGDVEIGFRFGVLDRPRTEQRRVGLQIALASAVRLPTGSTQNPSEIANLSTGAGVLAVDTRLALDARAGRAGLLAVGEFATSVHDNDTTTSTTRNSRLTEISVAPRWHFAEALSVHAAYSLRSTDKLGGDQLVGGGVTYSSLSTYRAGRNGAGHSLPMEMRYTHLQAITGDAGRPKFFRDQIEIRLYFRLR